MNCRPSKPAQLLAARPELQNARHPTLLSWRHRPALVPCSYVQLEEGPRAARCRTSTQRMPVHSLPIHISLRRAGARTRRPARAQLSRARVAYPFLPFVLLLDSRPQVAAGTAPRHFFSRIPSALCAPARRRRAAQQRGAAAAAAGGRSTSLCLVSPFFSFASHNPCSTPRAA